MRLLLFIFLEVWLLPVQILAFVLIAVGVKRGAGTGVTVTAGKPHDTRHILHKAGYRPDEAVNQIGPHLPHRGPFVHWALGTVGLALRWSGWDSASLRYPPDRPAPIALFVHRRTWFFDQCLERAIQDGVKQVVILGAGWDVRGWGLLADRGVEVFEVDMPATQAVKKQAVAAGGLPMDAVRFVSTDFMEKTWLEAITEAGFDASLPTFFLLEGLIYYLDDASIEATLRDIAAAAPGSALAFDYLALEVIRGEEPHQKLHEQMVGRMERFAPDEPLLSGISTQGDAKGTMVEWLAGVDLELVEWEPFGSETDPFGGLVFAAVAVEA
ncbi:MAG: class I SAM-dependent methyltransferase [Proteobacteria bacterium]|nr:class I SAM-dependent methyltransferase [Pseudomonadota bacterium]